MSPCWQPLPLTFLRYTAPCILCTKSGCQSTPCDAPPIYWHHGFNPQQSQCRSGQRLSPKSYQHLTAYDSKSHPQDWSPCALLSYSAAWRNSARALRLAKRWNWAAKPFQSGPIKHRPGSSQLRLVRGERTPHLSNCISSQKKERKTTAKSLEFLISEDLW